MARAVKVLLYTAGSSETINLADQGLLNMEFTRFVQNDKDANRNFLQEVQLSFFDHSGFTLLNNLQANNGKVRLQYGWADDNNLSEVFKLTAIKFKVRYEALGTAASVQAVGTQEVKTFPGEIWQAGTRVRDIIEIMAERNNWYIGEPGKTDFVDVGDLRLTTNLVKPNKKLDFDFINEDLRPILKRSLLVRSSGDLLTSWEVLRVVNGGRVELYCRPANSRKTTKRVWRYHHGSSGNKDSEIVSVTNDIDMSFLLDGIAIEIPITSIESNLLPSDENLTEYLQSKVASHWGQVSSLMLSNNLPIPDVTNFIFNVRVTDQEEIGNKTVDDYILDKMESIIKMLNTIELVVVGNPKIMPTDLVELTVKNRDGTNSVISSTGKSLWKVLEIKEVIGLSGYHTSLKLVRETSTIKLPQVAQSTHDGIGAGGHAAIRVEYQIVEAD